MAMDEKFSIFKALGKEESVKMVLEATEKLREALKPKKSDTEKLSEKARKIKELCISYGPPGIRLAELLSVVIEEDIHIQNTDRLFPYIPLSCVIVKEKAGNHNYEINKPLIVLLSENNLSNPNNVRLLKSDCTVGNYLQAKEKYIKIPDDKDVVKHVLSFFD